MAVSKVEFDGETLVDLTSDTVNENNLLSGAVAHDASGETVEGKVFITDVERVTQAEYDELPESKNADDKIYLITDGDSTGLQLDNLPETTELTLEDKFLLGVNGVNKSIIAENLMKGMNGYLPKGMKSLTKEFTVVTPSNVACVVICDLSDFGIVDASEVVGVLGRSNTYSGVWYSISTNNKILCNYYVNLPTGNVTHTISLIVKDYSEIGSEIVTENVKMITKTVTATFSNQPNKALIPISEFGVGKEDVITMMVSCPTLAMASPFFRTTDDYVCAGTTNSITGTYVITVSLFVRVPVVEQLPRFTKDVEVTLPANGSSTTLLTLDGSENVGGFTKDNFHSISISGIDIYVQYRVMTDSRIVVCNADKETGVKSGTVRITIE